MDVIRVQNEQEMSEKAASLLFQQIQQKPHTVLGLATGGTPKGTYRVFVQKAEKENIDLSHVTTFNLDEYVGLLPSDTHSYHYYMDEHFFQPLRLDKEQTYLPRGDAPDIEQETKRYEQLITQHGGMDVQLLGIGENGHIGFNEPGTSFSSRTHVVDLNESTRQANARYFESLQAVPKQAVTMGIATIMGSRQIVLLASGERKQEAMKRLLEGDIDESFPASILKKHPYVTIIADKKALSLVSYKDMVRG
ncbi:glucosamine-6-phosphate deaminase [Alteribacillus persepolensis]|uniref:Glucosamine-6-phosphate deaminase n=1 Tax=Alteribacillus persepolensis TaxID=568899 RepID=A0A1G8B115_9BACI|nr:glucosamine-6-phosphate deaminase [Alteribacillus persepolensis]SDH26814.1 glucosamine-6-phosphate deaminase [Alteribacillus persepolensis]